jgi:hypothetical protein
MFSSSAETIIKIACGNESNNSDSTEKLNAQRIGKIFMFSKHDRKRFRFVYFIVALITRLHHSCINNFRGCFQCSSSDHSALRMLIWRAIIWNDQMWSNLDTCKSFLSFPLNYPSRSELILINCISSLVR